MIATNDYFPIKTKFNFKIDFDNYPFKSNMFQFLIEQLPCLSFNNSKEMAKMQMEMNDMKDKMEELSIKMKEMEKLIKEDRNGKK